MALDLLGSDVLTSAATTMEVASLSGSYDVLMIVVNCKTDRSTETTDSILMRFNSDSGASSYAWRRMFDGNSSTNSTDYADSSMNLGIVQGDDSSPAVDPDAFANVVAYVPSYASTDHDKVMTSVCSQLDASNSISYVSHCVGQWLSTSAITTVTVLPAFSSNFAAESALYVYGM